MTTEELKRRVIELTNAKLRQRDPRMQFAVEERYAPAIHAFVESLVEVLQPRPEPGYRFAIEREDE